MDDPRDETDYIFAHASFPMTDTRDWIDLLERREREAEAHETLAHSKNSETHVGQAVVRARRSVGLTADQLAQRVDTCPRALRGLEESADEGHSVPLLQRIAKALDMDLRVGFTPRR